MKFALVTILLTSAVTAQQSSASRHVGIAAALQGSYAGLKSIVIGEAAKMPEADYEFKPSSMPEVRTFGQVIAHIADAQFDTCANVKGVSNPNQGKHLEQDLKTKADFTKALADSFAFCDDVFSATTDENALQSIRAQLGPRLLELPRASVLYGLLAHTSEMYGIGTVYLRAKELVPPASEPQGRGRSGR
jgi:hypothetical protein